MSDQSRGVTRRTALRTAGGVAAGLAVSGGLPAWARPIADATKLRQPGSRPFPTLPEGHETMPQIEHVVVLMMENHSFDNFLGMLPHQRRSRRKVDGLTVDRRGRPTNANPAVDGAPVRASRSDSPCQGMGVGQTWAASHKAYDNGRNDGFVRASSPQAMLYFDQGHLPFSYSLAATFPIGDRYFSSTLCQTYPNRRFQFTATASGTVATDNTTFKVPAANGSIFDRLDHHHITWKDYYDNAASIAIVPGVLTASRSAKNLAKIDQFFLDAKQGRLPAFSFVEPQYDTESQENPQDIQVGERFMAQVVQALMHSPKWKSTVLFINYDEGGGYYDHVPPPKAIAPDGIAPMLGPDDPPGAYDRYGFRVPFYVVSPWARRNYVSHVTADHTSVLRFVERKWNLGAMTLRDANAHDLTDYFDFRKPAFLDPPKLAAAPTLAAGLARCTADGLHPPLPGQPGSGDGDAG